MTKYVSPITIGKESTPYMYLSANSGVRINDYPIDGDRGLYLDINPSLHDDYYLLSLQIWLRWPIDLFPEADTLTFATIEGDGFSVNLSLDIDGADRARVIVDTTADLYQNGIKTTTPVLTPGIWNSLYVTFKESLSFAEYNGRIILWPGFQFNNISEYIYENPIIEDSRLVYIAWEQVDIPDFEEPDEHNTWEDIEDETWEEVTTTTITLNDYLIDGSYLYNDQTGISVVVIEDTSVVEVFANGADVFTGVEWTTIEKSLV